MVGNDRTIPVREQWPSHRSAGAVGGTPGHNKDAK